MSDDHYYIRREEWQEVRDTVRRIESAVTAFLEREKASDAAITRAQLTADRANKRIDELSVTVAAIERTTDINSDNWLDVKNLTFKVMGALIILGIAGLIGFFVGAG